MESSIRTSLADATSSTPCIFCVHSLDAFEIAQVNPGSKSKKCNCDSVCLFFTHTASLLAQILSEVKIPPGLVFVGTTPTLDELSSSIRACFPHQFNVPVPTENSRSEMLSSLLSAVPQSSDISIKASTLPCFS